MKLAVVIITFLLVSSSAYADDHNLRTVSVSGHSEITIEAETATISTNIRIVDKDMDEGYNKLESIVKNVVKDLYSLGIKDKDIDRSIITQGKETKYDNGKHKFIGYFSQSMIKIKLKDVNKLAKLYKILAKYEDLTTQNVIFDRSDIFELKLKEYEKALKHAKIKAETMVKTLGSKLGKVKTISSDTYSSPVPYRAMAMDSYKNSATESISTANVGFIKVSAVVSVVFYIVE